jgi:hypothetical protein
MPYTRPHEDGDFIICGCCGAMIHHTKEENVHYGREPYPDDNGFGMCRGCGGMQGHPDKPEEYPDVNNEEEVKEAMGWAACCFYETRFDTIRGALNEKNRKNWDGLSYLKKVRIVQMFLEDGTLKW